jgi:endonuclease/exonuclease/phosphatase (EEP) superfamily protein YafD
LSNIILRFGGYILFAIILLISIGATLLPFLHSKEWYIRIFDYPRLQTFFIALAALTWYLVLYYKKSAGSIVIVAVLICIIIIQAYKAWPYTALAPVQVKKTDKEPGDSSTISLFISNVLQDNDSYFKVLNEIEKYNPDIIITTETNLIWEKALEGLRQKYEYFVPVPQENKYGMHLYSKFPLEQTEVRYLVQDDIPSIRTNLKLRNGALIHLFIIHPKPPAPGEEDDSEERDAEIITVGKEAKKERNGVIVAGDFNDVAWSRTTELFQEFTGFLDPRRGRGFFNTFNAKYPIMRWPLDHIFHSNHFKLVAIERAGKVDSDHFPMYIKLNYEPEEKEDQEKVKADKDTDEKAAEAIREGKGSKN